MLCPLVSPDQLRRALLLSGHEPPTLAHLAVDIPEDELEVGGAETAAASWHISPVCRVAVRAVFVAYTAFAAPALSATAVTRFGGGDLRALLVLLLVVLTVAALFMATVRVSEDEEREREEQEEKGLHG